MHKGKKHKSIMEGYNDFARSEGAEAKKYVDSVRTNNPFGEGVDDMMDEESRRRERGYYVKGDVISQKGKKIVSTPDGTSRKSALNMLGISRKSSPLNFKGANSSNSSCWKGYKKVGTKPSPSGTGETVNDCKKI
tara:strand:+ start:220 stop:624 length:405 start_codon:yes stop_codon:yes gene_type:complete